MLEVFIFTINLFGICNIDKNIIFVVSKFNAIKLSFILKTFVRFLFDIILHNVFKFSSFLNTIPCLYDLDFVVRWHHFVAYHILYIIQALAHE